MTRFWWIRHAPVVGNNYCCYGNNEVDCNTSDTYSFRNLLSKIPENCDVYTSNLSRTIRTFNALVDIGYKYKSHTKDTRITEQDLGNYTGMKYEDLYKLTKKIGVYEENWLMNANHIPPNGESFIDLRNRVESFIQDKLKVFKNKDLVIFSHGGPIRAAISNALGCAKHVIIPVQIDNTKLTRIDVDEKNKSRILFINN